MKAFYAQYVDYSGDLYVKNHKGLALSENSPYVSHIAAYGL